MDRDKAAVVLEKVSEGLSLRKAAKEAGTSKSAFLDWVKADTQLADQYARAREVGTDAEFESLSDIADEEPPEVEGKRDAAWVQWQKLRIDTRKWTLARKAPKKYGDRVTADLNLSVRDLGDDELKARAEKLQALLAAAAAPSTKPDDSASD